MNKDSYNKLSVYALVSSLAGFVMFHSASFGVTDYLTYDLNWEKNHFFVISPILMLAGLVLGLLGFEKIKRTGEMGKSLAITAIIILPLSIAIFLLEAIG